MSFSPSPALPAKLPPNLLVGFLLNFVLPGSGFTYIDQPWWHLGWALLTLLSVVIFLLVLLPALIFLPMLAFLIMHVQYLLTYRRRFPAGSPFAGLGNNLKWGLIGGHLALNVIGAVLMVIFTMQSLLIPFPSLLNVHTRAQDATVSFYMRAVQTAAFADALNHKPYSGPCTGIPDAPATPDTIRSCEVKTTNAVDAPHVSVTTTQGKILTLP